MAITIQEIDGFLTAAPGQTMALWKLVNKFLQDSGKKRVNDPDDFTPSGSHKGSDFHGYLKQVEEALSASGRFIYEPEEPVGIDDNPRYNHRVSRTVTLEE